MVVTERFVHMRLRKQEIQAADNVIESISRNREITSYYKQRKESFGQ